ncbi:hypothetical protein A2U01_0075853 [Trifolium medium]|uniref:Uncharacterized protein n=1 Tax=Trifolium medium TaxID=97028 RepID=A0A392T0E8_9FABA|nr:hypothetical protein [Trifolium medium]
MLFDAWFGVLEANKPSWSSKKHFGLEMGINLPASPRAQEGCALRPGMALRRFRPLPVAPCALRRTLFTG